MGEHQPVRKRPPTKTSCQPGAIPGSAVLTPQNALDLRDLYDSGTSISKLAKVYGISYQHAWCIVKNKKWKNAVRQV
jgi:molybdenum-dependent DNA-binding transcriptional regulator ModE